MKGDDAVPQLSGTMGTTFKAGTPAQSQRANLPLVSVIIPYYKQAEFIRDTVMSVLNQTYPNVELIVVDDGSPVPAAPALAGIGGFQLYETANSGCPAARNYGFERSSGEYLVFLDGDDLLRPRAIEKNLETLRRSPKAILSFGAVRVVGGVGNELTRSRVSRARRDYFSFLLETNPIWTCGATIIRREAFVRAGKFRSLRKFQVDDYDLYLQLARVGPFVQHDECILDYRRHGGNMSNDRERMLAATMEVLDRLGDEVPLTGFQRVQLWHGRRRWINAFRVEDTRRGRWLDRYFRYASMWNIRWDDLLLELYRAAKRKCGWEPTQIGVKSPIVASDAKGRI